MTIIPVVIIVLKKCNHFVLVVNSTKLNGKAFPGGKIKFGETIREATMREAKEELGIDVKVERIIGYGEMITAGYAGDRKYLSYAELNALPETQKRNFINPCSKKHYLFYTVLCSKKFKNSRVVLNEEATECFWVTINELEECGLNGIWEQPIGHIKQSMFKNPY